MNGSAPLSNPKWERFALLVATGEVSAAEAYRKTISAKCTDKTSHERASKIASNDKVRARIADLRSKAAVVASERAGEVVLSIAEKRLFLAAVVRTPSGAIDKHSQLCQEWSETHGEHSSSTKLKMPDKLAAIKLDNDLAGEGSEANKEPLVIVVRIGGGDGDD